MLLTQSTLAQRLDGLPGLGPATHVMTTEGEVPVEWLATGDRVLTRDHGAQPILWIGRARVGQMDLEDAPWLDPIEIGEGALGDGCPTHPTWLARGNRVLLSGAMVDLHAGVDEALAEVEHLIDGVLVTPRRTQGTYYTQFLLPMHEMVQANGLWVETLQLDTATLRALGDDLPPEIVSDGALRVRHALTARLCLEDWEVVAMRGARVGAVSQLIRHVA